MYLYQLTLQTTSGIQCAVYGNFSTAKAQEIVVSRGKVLELLRPDESGRMQTVLRRVPPPPPGAGPTNPATQGPSPRSGAEPADAGAG